MPGSADSAELLTPDAPVERNLPPNTKHTYDISVSAGDYVRVVLESFQFQVTASLLAPDGKLMLPDSRLGVPSVVLPAVAPVSGVYRIEVNWSSPPGEIARYRLRLDRPRAATPADRDLTRAFEAYRQASQPFASGRPKPEPELRKSAEILSRTQEQFRLAGEREGEAEVLYGLGILYGYLSERQLQEQDLARASEAWRSLGNSHAGRVAAFELCMLDRQLGRAGAAVDEASKLLAEARAAGDLAQQKTTLAFLAELALTDGDYERLIEYYKEALALETNVASVPYANALQNLGGAFCRVNEMRTCLEYRERAATIYRTQGAAKELQGLLMQMSGLYQALGDWQAALRASQEAGRGVPPVVLAKTDHYAQAIETAQQIISRDHERGEAVNEAVVWMNLAGIYADGNEPDRALQCLDESLRTYPEGARGLAQFRYAVGQIYLQLGHPEEALGLFRQFLNGGMDAESPNYAGMVGHIARAERDAGLLDDARAHAETAVARWEEQRSRIASPELSASFFSQTEIDEVYIDILMAQQERSPEKGTAAMAFAVNDRARARSLIASLGETVGRIREGVDPKLLERERALQREFNRAAALQQRGAQGKDAAAQIDRLSGELKLLRGEIRLSSPSYASLTEPPALNLAEIQKQVLAPDTLLLEYSLGEKRSFLWVVGPDALHSFVLPPRAAIESAARRVYDLVAAPRAARRGETQSQSRERIARAEAAYFPAAAALSRIILGPAAGLLGERRLLIVADGALSYVSFSALPDPGSGKPLVGAHEIVHLPSASALAALRAEAATRKNSAQRRIAVLADPVFEANDERLPGGPRGPLAVSAEADDRGELTKALSAAGLDASGAGLPRLVFSRREAGNIATAARPGSVSSYLDFRANHALVTSAEMARFNIVHFATHAVLNDETPELSGIVLSLVDEKGKPQDGFLRLHEIYNLHLPVDLVVLSACQTALGKEIRGEGIASLSRGFMYAGAERVIASLWKVDDAATADLMGRFYHNLLVERLRPAAALRSAQLALGQQARWRSPYYWAAFELQGEWK